MFGHGILERQNEQVFGGTCNNLFCKNTLKTFSIFYVYFN